MKKNVFVCLLFLVLMPMAVYAKSDDSFDIIAAIAVETFISVHMSLMVLLPLAKIINAKKYKSIFLAMFAIRAAVLLFFDFFITTNIFIVDFFAVFVGTCVVSVISLFRKSKIMADQKQALTISSSSLNENLATNLVLKCANCGNVMKVTDKFCSNCGKPFSGNNVVVSEGQIEKTIPKKIVYSKDFDSIYNFSEKKLVEEFIKREMYKLDMPLHDKMLPHDMLKRKTILNILFSFLIFIYISLIFFHFPIYTYLIGLIILVIYAFFISRMSLVKYLVKQVKARPNEKISNIVMSTKENLLVSNTKSVLIIGLLVAVILPIAIFFEPHAIYDQKDNGYVLRFYTFGLNNFNTVTVPDMYHGKKVIGLRGGAFANMFFLKEVYLPNTIKEIRGRAFANDVNLEKINIPTELEYLGGGAFYNCKSIDKIVLPNTVTYLGGEAFYNCLSLDEVVLSSNLLEIRGNTFEECTGLEKIEIPDKVQRIGGHAFYGCSSLREVLISENSSLKEIGSSAFRRCYNLDQIFIPQDTYVNFRAFKESPTSINRYNDNFDLNNSSY